MAKLAWLNEVQRRLTQSSLPPTYIRRLVEELADHLEDVTEEIMNTDTNMSSRLGDPNQVAEAAIVAYRRRSFLGRHPTAAFLVFGVSPVVSVIVLIAVMVAGLVVIGKTAEHLGWIDIDKHFGYVSNDGRFVVPGSVELVVVPCLMTLLTIVIPSLLASILYSRLAQRLNMARAWVFISCAVVGAIVFLPFWQVRLDSLAGYKGIHYCVWIPVLCGWIPPNIVHQLIQLAVPLAVGWWFVRHSHNYGKAQLAS